jgi:hypothetical protein
MGHRTRAGEERQGRRHHLHVCKGERGEESTAGTALHCIVHRIMCFLLTSLQQQIHPECSSVV